MLNFCIARERLLKEMRRTERERKAHVKEERALRTEVEEAMRRNKVDTICVGDDLVVKMRQQRLRAPAITDVEEVLNLIKGSLQEVTDIEASRLPDAVARLVGNRFQARAPYGPEKLTICRKKQADVVKPLPSEAIETVSEYEKLRARKKELRAQLAPLRKAQRDAERELEPQIPCATEGSSVEDGSNAGAQKIKVQQGEHRLLQIERVPIRRKNVAIGKREMFQLRCSLRDLVDSKTPRHELEALLLVRVIGCEKFI